jgi:thiol:disulfide interchange protein
MKSRTILIALIALSLVATAFGKKKAPGPTEVSSLEEALSAKRPAVVMFVNSKACGCILRACNASGIHFQATIDENPGNFVYLEVDIAHNPELVEEYQMFVVPAVVFFNEKGEETARLRSRQITPQSLKEHLEKYAGVSPQEKKEKK